ncbi:MAG TPA: cytochrome c oxidase assembly protein [Thermoanaerobaculia bacterium]|nr:cytochrome c oxidase assembly protein [Thermoanaerobaculia bacterium]
MRGSGRLADVHRPRLHQRRHRRALRPAASHPLKKAGGASPAFFHPSRSPPWGLSALEDQQLAGLIMWVPAGVVFILLGLGLFAAWLGEAERRVAHTRSERLLRERNAHGT